MIPITALSPRPGPGKPWIRCKWRQEILLKEACLIALADLGYGVLGTAMGGAEA